MNKIPKIVTLSGGSGGFTVCRALSRYPLSITAIPSVFDSGGSTGVLRDVYGALPQGDVRRCILALLPSEDMEWRQLLSFRFDKAGPFSNHSLGNLLLFAAEREWGREGGVNVLCKLLKTNGRVIPVSVDSADLCAELSDGSEICGEAMIDLRSHTDERSIKKIFLDRPATATREAVKSIMEADLVVLSPGDLFTSLLPNFLVEGITRSLNETSAKIVYIMNLMTKASETRDFTAESFVSELYRYGLTRKIDYLVVNDQEIPREILGKYWDNEGSKKVVLPTTGKESDSTLWHNLVLAPLLSRRGLAEGLVRHSTHELGRVINGIILDIRNK